LSLLLLNFKQLFDHLSPTSKNMADIDKLQKDAVASIASVSTLLRNAIGASLPVAPEQYLTIAIPGTVIDMADYDQGGSFVYDVAKHATPPTTVRQSEGRLVDGMMPISKIMVRTILEEAKFLLTLRR
jgi:hypothetical protein